MKRRTICHNCLLNNIRGGKYTVISDTSNLDYRVFCSAKCLSVFYGDIQKNSLKFLSYVEMIIKKRKVCRPFTGKGSVSRLRRVGNNGKDKPSES